MTARNVQDEAKMKGLPWSIAKGFDTFLPISEIIPKSAITDPHNVRLTLAVNGEIRQDGNTEQMIFRIGRQLSDISKVMTMEPGDIVLTGTPKGVGEVVKGDRLEAAAESGGKVIEQSRIDVTVEYKLGPYVFTET